MSSLTNLALAAAIMVAAFTFFAIARRLALSPRAPRGLTTGAVAFGLALGLTVMFALSLFNVANALQAHVLNVAVAGLLAVAMHAITWSIVRLVIPAKTGSSGHKPHVDLTGGGAVPKAA